MAAQVTTEVKQSHEERAQLIANVMQSRRGSDVGRVLAERTALITSVKWLGNQVPVCVLNRLGEEIKLQRQLLDAEEDDEYATGFDSESSFDSSFGDYSAEMVRTQDLLSEIRKEQEKSRRQNSSSNNNNNSNNNNKPVEAVRQGNSLSRSVSHAGLAPLSEEPDDRSNEDLDNLMPPRQPRKQKRPSTCGGKGPGRRSPLSEEPGDESIEYLDILMPTPRQPRKRLSTGTGGGNGRRQSFESFGEMSALSNEGWDDSSTGSLSRAERRASSGPLQGKTRATINDVPEIPALSLPYASTHECALLFVDISGFTELSTKLDPEKLSTVINAYFELIVNLVTSHGGDVLKFAGDAIFAEWQASSDNSTHAFLPHTDQSRRKIALSECVACAATCGAKIVHKCSDYLVFANGESGKTGMGEPIATLNVHCGLGAGQIVGVHVGSASYRREYLILGTPLEQVAIAAEHASFGELHASPDALEIMSKGCQLLDESFALDGRTKPVLIARKNLAGFTPKIPKQQRRCSVTHLWEGWDTKLLEDYRQLICSYAHPVVVDNELNSPHQLRLLTSTAKQRQVEEAEIRSVYVMFISMPRIDCSVGKDQDKDKALFELLNSIMELTTRELERFRGHLRQFIVDDKGLVLIATFGLRGSTSPNMVAERALPATMVIHAALQNELDVFNRIGVTFGNAYCGVVGGVKRHEYAVMGPSVNLAARLMCSARNPGILVSEAVRVKAGKMFAFNALPPVRAKGYALPVSIFEPLSSLERTWGRRTSSFVGRVAELNEILFLAKETKKPLSLARVLFLAAESGTGKTTLVVQVMEHLRKAMHKSRKQQRIAKHVCREGDVLVPFSIFRSILPDILLDFEGATTDEKTLQSGGPDSVEMEWDNMSRFSHLSRASVSTSSSSGRMSSGRMSRLVRLVNELDAPTEFVDLLVHHLLGLGSAGQADRPHTKKPNITTSITYLVKLFQRWAGQSQFTVLALDDVHFMDEVSWQVVQRLLDSTRNLFVVCTSRPLKTYKLAINEDFWDELNSKYKQEGRFVYMELSRLSKEDIRAMVAKRLKLDEQEIDESFLRDVYTQSGGMPAFANEILQSAGRRNSIGRQGNNRMGWTRSDRGKGELTHASVGDMIIHRLDNFNQLERVVLNLGAVLGVSFDLRDIINVTHRFANTSIEKQAGYSQEIHNALNRLVAEGVLLEVCLGGGDTEDEGISVDYVGSEGQFENTPPNYSSDKNSLTNMSSEFQDKSYTFSHDVWRTSILKLMLESRKKQIHSIIATSLETQARTETMDYVSQMKLWNHWKAAGDAGKAANSALTIGKSFEELGLHDQSIKLYEETLELMQGPGCNEADGIGGFSSELLNLITRSDLEHLIKVHIALGKVLANVHRGADSVVAYQNALQIMQASPSARYIRDRAIIFPIFSGLFLALKFGQIEQDEECLYEQNLVRRFVAETKLHGDPVHYTRALAMQADMYGRLRDFPAAFEAFEELKRHYDAEKHSNAICNAYGSDRSAQCFGISLLWHMQLGDMKAAEETCWYIFEHLMPKMELRNVHNSAIMIYPTIWVMKDLGRCTEVLEMFVKYVVEPFDEFLGEGAFTFCLPVYDPVMMLLDLCEHEENDECENFDDFLAWGLDEENLRFGTVINNSLGGFGRDCNSIASEICLQLAKRTELDDNRYSGMRAQLVSNGLVIARESMEYTTDKQMYAAQLQVKPVLEALETLADGLNLEV